jgi:hypothetical protein
MCGARLTGLGGYDGAGNDHGQWTPFGPDRGMIA